MVRFLWDITGDGLMNMDLKVLNEGMPMDGLNEILLVLIRWYDALTILPYSDFKFV